MQPVNRPIVSPNVPPDPATVQLHTDGEPPGRRRIRASAILAIIADHYLGILVFAFLCGALAVGLVMRQPRKYAATVTVAPVGNARQLNLPSSIAGSLLGAANTGIQATPVFVARLARLPGVLDEVARQPIPERRQIVIEGVLKQRLVDIPPHKYAQELDKRLQTTIDRESGTVTFVAALADSSLARVIVNDLVESVRRAYTRAMKSQAGALVEAQTARVDSAAKRMREAESAIVSFGSANRMVPQTSPLWVEQQRLQNNVTIAQTIYTQAITELENARGKAIEDAPALVVLDPAPEALTPRGRGTVFIGLATFVLAFVAASAFVLVREAAANVYSSADRDMVHLVSSLERLPVIGKRGVRWFLRT
jgi:uncharacterized protein involved in exopolysaccharide biosynthesis